MKVNTHGADLSSLSSNGQHYQMEGRPGDDGVSVTSSGSNSGGTENKAVPQVRQLDSGPRLDPKTHSYQPSTYETVVRSSSGSNGTKIIRQDR